jgi:hypothetical protein
VSQHADWAEDNPHGLHHLGDHGRAVHYFRVL